MTKEDFKKQYEKIGREVRDLFEKEMHHRRVVSQTQEARQVKMGEKKTLCAEYASQFTELKSGDKVVVTYEEPIGWTGRFKTVEESVVVNTIVGRWYEGKEEMSVEFTLLKMKKDGTASKQNYKRGRTFTEDMLRKL